MPIQMKLLTAAILNKLPKLYAQDGKGSKAEIFIKFFTPDSNWTWFITEGQPVLDEEGNQVDFEFFGLVDGHDWELGYTTLNQLLEVRGSMGLCVERDRNFSGKTLKDVAPSGYFDYEKEKVS